MKMKVGDTIVETAASDQCRGVWPHGGKGEGTIISIEPWCGAWLLSVDWGEDWGVLPMRCETLEYCPEAQADESEPGFSAEYGTWYGCDRKKEKSYKKDKMAQAYGEENLRHLFGLD